MGGGATTSRSIAFGSLTVLDGSKIHGFASLPHNRFAFIGAIELKRAATGKMIAQPNVVCQDLIILF